MMRRLRLLYLALFCSDELESCLRAVSSNSRVDSECAWADFYLRKSDPWEVK